MKRRLKILITAGPTREYLDPVRYLSNASTGKMGYAIAAAAAKRGHAVTLISGPVELPAPRGVRLIRVTSALEMLAAARRAFSSADAAVFAAAVCDVRPRRPQSRKLPKSALARALSLLPNPDIAATLGRIKRRPARPPRVTIGFALESHDGRAKAAAKLRAKHFDAIVLNSPAAIAADRSDVEILSADGRWQRPRTASKSSHALQIVRHLEELAAAGLAGRS